MSAACTAMKTCAGRRRWRRAQAVLGAEERKILLDTSTPGERVLAVRAADGTGSGAAYPYVVAGTAPVLGDALLRPRAARPIWTRKDYNPGETMKVMLTTPYRGAGLITVERERVVAEKWFRPRGEPKFGKLPCRPISRGGPT